MSNDPYSRPINATRPEHKIAGEHYGTLATDKKRSIAAGNPNAASAFGVYSTAPYDVVAAVDRALPVFEHVALATDSPEPTTPNTDVTSPSDDEDEPVITEEDLFG